MGITAAVMALEAAARLPAAMATSTTNSFHPTQGCLKTVTTDQLTQQVAMATTMDPMVQEAAAALVAAMATRIALRGKTVTPAKVLASHQLVFAQELRLVKMIADAVDFHDTFSRPISLFSLPNQQ